MSDIEIDQLSPNSAKAKLKECSNKIQENQGLISPLGDSVSMISRLSRCVNELECLRLDLYNSFVDHLDLIPIKVSVQPELDPNAFTFKWEVGRELQRNDVGGFRTDFCVGRQYIQ